MDSGREEFRAYWLPLVAAFVGITLGVMSIPFYFLGPMIKPLEAAFGWSQVELLSASSLMAIGITLISPVAGWLADRTEARILVATSLLMLGACYAAAALMRELWQFQLIYFLTGFLGGIGGATALTRVIGARFVHARGLAIGIVLSGTGVASFAAPLFVHALVSAAGWQSVWWALAGLSVFVAMPITWFGLGTSRVIAGSPTPLPERPVYGVTLREASRDPRFYILLITILLFGLPISSTILNLVPMLQDRGADPARAAGTASILGIMILVGRLVIGLLLDRIRPSLVGIGIFALATIGSTALLVGGIDYAILTVIALGFMLGAEIDLMSFITLRYFGTRAYGIIFALMFGTYTLISIVGPVAGGLLIEARGYEAIYQVAVAAWGAATLAFVLLSRMSDEKPLMPDATGH